MSEKMDPCTGREGFSRSGPAKADGTLPEAVINPAPGPGEAAVPPRIILTFARPDFQFLCRQVQADTRSRHIWDCTLRSSRWRGRSLAVVSPAVGAPYAAMVMEKLIALGARLILALGWGGSLQAGVPIGSVVLPAAAVSGDGTSRQYIRPGRVLAPEPRLQVLLAEQLEAAGIFFQEGTVWTTDALYRETVDQVRHYQAKGVLAVDLEMAALFAVGQFRRVPVAGLLVISDELATFTWRQGHSSRKFRQTREAAARLLLEVAAQWETEDA